MIAPRDATETGLELADCPPQHALSLQNQPVPEKCNG